jgi:UDP-N-acetyl-D-mannosaminuronic acid dehydrogenase
VDVAGRDFSLIYSYERVMAGRLLHNLSLYDRIVGGIDPESTRRGIVLYRHIVKASLHPTDALTAEVAKVTENAYRDVNIAFANEIAIICESLGVNVHDVRRFVNSLPNDPSNPSNPFRACISQARSCVLPPKGQLATKWSRRMRFLQSNQT